MQRIFRIVRYVPLYEAQPRGNYYGRLGCGSIFTLGPVHTRTLTHGHNLCPHLTTSRVCGLGLARMEINLACDSHLNKRALDKHFITDFCFTST